MIQNKKDHAPHNIKRSPAFCTLHTVLMKWKTYRHAGDSRPHGTRPSEQWHNQQCRRNNQCQLNIPPVPRGTHIKFPEQIQERPAVWTVFLILIKYSHTDSHTNQQTDHTQHIGMSTHIIPLQKQISKDKRGLVWHDHIVASENHENQNTCHIHKKCRNRMHHIGNSRSCD